MIAGPARSGKSALANFLNGEERPLKRTLDTSYRQRTLEVPSAYIENTWMYQHLIALAQDAWCILVLVDQENPQPLYSPGICADLSLPGGGRHQQMRSGTAKPSARRAPAGRDRRRGSVFCREHGDGRRPG